MITKVVRELIETYSFIEKTELKDGMIYLYYKKDDKEKRRRLPLRANKKRLMKLIEEIKSDINFYEKRLKLWKTKNKKDSAFAFTGDWDGEEYDKRKESYSKTGSRKDS